MGLIREAISQAAASSQVKNGFNGPQLPFMKNSLPSHRNVYQGSYQQSPRYNVHCSSARQCHQSIVEKPLRSPAPPQYEDLSDAPRGQAFRPLALPQIDYGDGQPFLRAYSDELWDRGIPQEQFLAVVDKINVAIIPNPELQIFQKAASIAGWFIPGAASFGLMAGQIVVGVGTAFGHASLVSHTLAKANLAVFLPQGLEICIGKAHNIDEEVGFQPMQEPCVSVNQQPEQRIAAYGDTLAPVTAAWLPATTGGRRDPLAFVGKALSQSKSSKKVEKAQKDMSKGKNKRMGSLETDLKWLIVREARPETLAHWQDVLQQSENALREEQEAVQQAEQRARYDERR